MCGPEILKIGAIKYKSRSAAALMYLKQVLAGKSRLSKADIAKKVGMTPQTVHAVQRNAGLSINFRAIQKANTERNAAARAKSEKKNTPKTTKAAKPNAQPSTQAA